MILYPRCAWSCVDKDLACNWESRQETRPALESVPEIKCLAKTTVFGDDDRLHEQAVANVDYALTILRAFLWPGRFNVLPQSSFTRNKQPSTTLYRDACANIVFYGHPNQVIDSDMSLNTLHNFNTIGCRLLLDNYNFNELRANNFEKAQVILSVPFGARTEWQNRIVRGLHWLGEASKLENLETSFVEIEFALETFLGEGSLDDSVTNRLTERTAFIIGGNPDDMYQIHLEIKDYIGKRNKIVHGSNYRVSLGDVLNFASKVQHVAINLLGMDFNKHTELQAWVFKRRYGIE